MTLSSTSQPPAQQPRKRRKNTEFWRAAGYLGRYRRIVTVSVVCAFLVGFITTAGLGAMLPILRVLLNGDTLQGYIDRQIVAHRIGVKFVDDPTQLSIYHVEPESPAQHIGLSAGDRIASVEHHAFFDDRSIPAEPNGPANLSLAVLATVDNTTLILTDGRRLRLVMPEQPVYMLIAQRIAAALPANPVKAVAVMFSFIFVLSLFGSVVRFFQEYLSDKAAISSINDIRRHLYDHVLHTPLSFFNTQGTSDVTSRLVADSQVLQDGFKTVLGQSVQEPIKAAFAFGLALILSWKLTLCIVLFAPLMAVAIQKFGKKMRRASRAAMQRSSDMLGQIEGTLVGIRVVKAATAERFERRRYSSILERLRQEQLKMARYEAWATPTMETVAMIVIGVVLIFATYQVTQKTLDSSKFLLIFGCLVSMGESLRRVSKVNATLQRSNASAQRIFEIIDLPMERRKLRENERLSPSPRNRGEGRGEGQDAPERKPTPDSTQPLSPTLSPEYRGEGAKRIKIPPIQKSIQFDDITFAYPNAQQNAVESVSLMVPKGASVAVVGRNGSGKTTLLALLPRFYDPQSGRVLIDGVDVRDATLRSVRQQIGIVTQESVIFPGTIAENIAYGLPRTRRSAIVEAAKRAFCDDFINEKPQAYDTPLDGLGGQLSGGQRQRLNIARAILRQSPILILDEATSQVDAESEHLIQMAIESIMHERTTFVIAHRFSTILSADTIVVMDRGRIVGQGKHEDLLRTCPTYKQLYERQLFAA